MKIVGCDLHAGQQSIAMMDSETGELAEKVLKHEGDAVREFYGARQGRVVVGIEATGAMQWFLELLEQLGIECRVGHPAKIRATETRQQKHDRRDAEPRWLRCPPPPDLAASHKTPVRHSLHAVIPSRLTRRF